MTLYAHTHPAGRDHWEPLTTHLTEVAERAASFAKDFGGDRLACLAGLWHDLGKTSDAFQRDVLGAGNDEAAADAEDTPGGRRVNHSNAGAHHAMATLHPAVGPLIAYGILGHHGRLPDYQWGGSDAAFAARIDPTVCAIPDWHLPADLPAAATDPPSLLAGISFPEESRPAAFAAAFLARMLYSALVDADRLCTEAFINPERAAQRPAPHPTPQSLLGKLNAHLDVLRESRQSDPAPVDRHRAAVLAACRKAAANEPGFYSLTVPTGGGKTLASAAFALTHAAAHGQRRLLFALPYTSIIEQTAKTFRDVFGETQVLEHHSNLDPDHPRNKHFPRQLAAENFDAPVVVTTNVQFFESLFSAHGGTCRKLHRFANAVIVLDEAQSMPPDLLGPTLAALQELVRSYGSTVVLCTATQPVIHRREGFDIGIDEVTEIVPDPPALYRAMKRVDVQQAGALDDDTLADRIAAQPQALCIVNTKKHAAGLFALLHDRTDDPDACVHLSAAMCPAHRSHVLAAVRVRLKEGRPVRVISTTVIEAGVDVDFPTVYRALTGFDSIAQAAGRCNREGRRATGEVFVFRPADPKAAAPQNLNDAVSIATGLLEAHPDPLALDAINAYFERMYWQRKHRGDVPWDIHDVMGCFAAAGQYNFRQADDRYRWIDSQTTPILVPYGDTGKELVALLSTWSADEPPDYRLLRRAQRYVVSVYDHQLQAMLANTTLHAPESYHGRIHVLTNPAAYDGQALGLRTDVAGHDASGSVI